MSVVLGVESECEAEVEVESRIVLDLSSRKARTRIVYNNTKSGWSPAFHVLVCVRDAHRHTCELASFLKIEIDL